VLMNLGVNIMQGSKVEQRKRIQCMPKNSSNSGLPLSINSNSIFLNVIELIN
jgi:hypothetical protein